MEGSLRSGRRGGRTLGIETSGRLAGVAVLEGERPAGEASLDTRRVQTETLLAITRRMLDDLRLNASDLDRIAFSEGPGSFTGLRVGMAAALGLAAGAGRPIVAVPTLEVLAYPWRSHRAPVVVLSGHRRGRLYLGAFQWKEDRFEPLIPPSNRSDEEMLREVSGIPSRRLLFVGDALDSLEDLIRVRLGGRAVFAPVVAARASDVASLSLDPLRPEWSGRDLEGRTPNYLREADARKPRNRADAPRSVDEA